MKVSCCFVACACDQVLVVKLRVLVPADHVIPRQTVHSTVTSTHVTVLKVKFCFAENISEKFLLCDYHVLCSQIILLQLCLMFTFWLVFPRPSPPVWLGGRVVRMLDLRSTGCEFYNWPPRCRVQPWASC